MALANCSRCGALFNKVTRDYCNECHEEEEKMLSQIQAYLRDNRQAPKTEILDEHEELETWMLDKWIEEGRVNLYDPDAEDLSDKSCIYCGRPVKGDGEICKTCQIRKSITEGKKPAAEPMAKPQEKAPEKSVRHGMHFKKR